MVLPLDSDFIPGPLHWNAALVHDADVYAHHWSTVANGSNVLVLNAIDTNKSLPTLYDHHTWARLVLQYGMCRMQPVNVLLLLLLLLRPVTVLLVSHGFPQAARAT